MDSLSYKTISANAATVDKQWVVIYATDEVLGRLASQVAKILRGKNKPSYTPHVDCGDYVIVINADKVKLTGKKMKLEIEGIFLWAFEGLQRLAANNFRFTESLRTLNNREYVKRDANNAIDFMESTGYIRLKADMSVTSKELYAIYGIWCDENGLTPIRQRSFSDFLMRNLKTYNLEHTNTVTNATGRRVWGYLGIEPLISPRISENWGKSLCTYVPES